MNTLYAIIGLFALGAMIGLYLFTLVMKSRNRPVAVAVIHGLFVGTALILLIRYTTTLSGPGPTESIVLFILAALGGLYMFFRDITGRSVPKFLAIGHAVIAVTGFIFLLVHAFGNEAA